MLKQVVLAVVMLVGSCLVTGSASAFCIRKKNRPTDELVCDMSRDATSLLFNQVMLRYDRGISSRGSGTDDQVVDVLDRVGTAVVLENCKPGQTLLFETALHLPYMERVSSRLLGQFCRVADIRRDHWRGQAMYIPVPQDVDYLRAQCEITKWDLISHQPQPPG